MKGIAFMWGKVEGRLYFYTFDVSDKGNPIGVRKSYRNAGTAGSAAALASGLAQAANAAVIQVIASDGYELILSYLSRFSGVEVTFSPPGREVKFFHGIPEDVKIRVTDIMKEVLGGDEFDGRKPDHRQLFATVLHLQGGKKSALDI